MPGQATHVMVSVLTCPSTITTVRPVLIWSKRMKCSRNRLHLVGQAWEVYRGRSANNVRNITF